jgi:hypothetical protein
VISPSNDLFGDTVTAVVEVTLDRERVDPGSVGVQAEFAPWKQVASPETLRRDAETTTYLRRAFVLRCLDRACAPSGESAVQELLPARVTYAARTGTGVDERSSVEVEWPALVIGSRYAATAGQGPASSRRWQADLLSFPAVSYSLRPGLLFALLLAGAAALAIAGAALAYRAWPRRAAPPRAEEPPGPVLTPLERALVLLEDPARVDGAADRRRALEFVACGLVKLGDLQLGQTARALAWSEPAPAVDKTSGLAARARTVLAEELYAHPE